jgi:hypothetical protein
LGEDFGELLLEAGIDEEEFAGNEEAMKLLEIEEDGGAKERSSEMDLKEVKNMKDVGDDIIREEENEDEDTVADGCNGVGTELNTDDFESNAN